MLTNITTLKSKQGPIDLGEYEENGKKMVQVMQNDDDYAIINLTKDDALELAKELTSWGSHRSLEEMSPENR